MIILLKFTKARESTCPKAWETCCRKDTHFDKPFDTIQRPIECGRRNNQEIIAERISGVSGSTREDTAFAEWPHMCIILQNLVQESKPTQYYKCGASLIAPDIVLTAAHCVRYAVYKIMQKYVSSVIKLLMLSFIMTINMLS